MTTRSLALEPKALIHVPSQTPSRVVRLLDWLMGRLGALGEGVPRVDSPAHHRLLKRGTRAAVSVEGEAWLAREAVLESLWQSELRSIDDTMHASAQPFSARLTMVGGVRLALERRCRVYEYLKTRRSVVEHKLPKPVVIVGLPRTGSTLLQRLLACDTRMASLPFWELVDPVPSRLGPLDIRQLKMKLGAAAIDWTTPGQLARINAFHPTDPEFADEETNLMWSAGIMNAAWWHHLDDASFGSVMDPIGKEAAYRFLRRSLQIIMAQRDERPFMLLKSPFHGLYLNTLLDTFPDAILISLHRKPEAVVRSWISFMAVISAPSFQSETVPITTFTGRQIDFLQKNAARLCDFLPRFEARHPDQHLALSFDELVTRPLEAVERIYGFLGAGGPDASTHRRMTDCLQGRAATASFATKMSFEELGLDARELSEGFCQYLSQWGHLMSL